MTIRSLFLGVALLLGATVATASEVKIFRMATQQAFLRGTPEGMSVDRLGTLRLAARAERLAAVAEPFVFAAAPHPDGWVLGTGNAGKVLLVRPGGEVEELFATAEPEVFAVWAAADGTVYAGSSPQGKVYRWRRGGEPEVFFAPEETYVWQLAPAPGGDLLVATGTQGRLFRVDARGRGTVIWDSDDTHVRSLAVRRDGSVLAGTSGSGLLVEIRDGSVRTLHDAAAPEVVAITAGADGTAWAAVVASEASPTPAPSPAATSKEGEDDDEAATGEATIVVSGQQEAPLGTRPPGFKGPRSEILRILPEGTVESIARLEEDTVFTLAWAGERLWVGSGLEGKLYSWRGEELVLENDVEDRQIVALVGAGDLPSFATTNAGALYRLEAGGGRRGTYLSPVLDAQQVARFGTFRWTGSSPPGGSVRFAFRSGLAAEPDPSWSGWSGWREGEEIPLEAVPGARYFQWKAEVEGGRTSPAISAVEVSYRQVNLAPRIASFDVLDPGQVLVDFNFNPANQVFEPATPNRDGIFTTLRPTDDQAEGRTRTLWRLGYRTLRWQASDPNGDSLRYGLTFRPEGVEGDWMPVAEDLDGSWYSFDATALPDGIYRFRLEASDRRAEQDEEALADTRIGEPVIVDHTPPALEGVRREGDRLVVTLVDARSPLREATWSLDAGTWRPAETGDGLLDGRREELVLPLGEQPRLLILRVSDAAFNTITFDLSRHLR